jgi:hypothetical protein
MPLFFKAAGIVMLVVLTAAASIAAQRVVVRPRVAQRPNDHQTVRA